jgi:hypothetical protein
MSEPEPELEPGPKLFESRSRSRSRNKKFRLHNTALLVVFLSVILRDRSLSQGIRPSMYAHLSVGMWRDGGHPFISKPILVQRMLRFRCGRWPATAGGLVSTIAVATARWTFAAATASGLSQTLKHRRRYRTGAGSSPPPRLVGWWGLFTTAPAGGLAGPLHRRRG